MGAQRVLIVDDSKTAQLRLNKMLKRYNVDIDVAFSAEEALGYLSYRIPAVIFLDHHMEGMDGLKALKIIKANPNTAMIPVIMYTSQRGDVYVGQARALGALDILSKEIIKPASVEQALARLNIYPRAAKPSVDSKHHKALPSKPSNTETANGEARDNKSVAEAKVDTVSTVSTVDNKAASAPSPADDLIQMRKQVARLFEIHIADVRNQMSENSRLIIRHLGTEIKRLKARNSATETRVVAPQKLPSVAAALYSKLFANALLALILTGLAVLALQIFQFQDKLSLITLQQHKLVDLGQQQHQQLTAITVDDSADLGLGTANAINSATLLDAISWAVNTNMNFPYSQPPLSEARVLSLRDLVHKLDSAGFTGLIKLNIHFGNFCVEQTASGAWAVADDNTQFSQCIFAQDIQAISSVDDYLSTRYLQFERNSMPILDGSINVELYVQEFDTPLSPYPIMNGSATAGDWNAIAARNNRISLEFEAQ